MSRTVRRLGPTEDGYLSARFLEEDGGRHAATGCEEGHEARASVRARQGVREGPRRVGGPRRGDRGAHGQQGEGALRRVADALEVLDEGPVAEPARRPALRRQPHPRRALRAGQAARHRGALEDEQDAARAGGGTEGEVWLCGRRSARALPSCGGGGGRDKGMAARGRGREPTRPRGLMLILL